MKDRASAESPSAPALSSQALFSCASASDTCMCSPEPSSPLKGLPMNVASRPSRAASSLTMSLKRKARSAAPSARLWRMLISYWLRPYSCVPATTPSPSATAASIIVASMSRGSARWPTV